ncbi:MAG: transcriptional regulator [Rhodospirillaceae bacterium]
MALTREFKDTIQARAQRDPAFRVGLLQEAVDAFLGGELEVGKTILRDYVNATLGFDELAKVTNKKPESLMRMLSSKGNPRADNLFDVLAKLQQREGVSLHVQAAE